MAGIGKYKGKGEYKMGGSSFYGKSPLYQKKGKSKDLYVTGTNDAEGNFAKDTSYVPKNSKYKAGDSYDETDYEKEHPNHSKKFIIQDVSNVQSKSKKNKPNLGGFSKKDFIKSKS
tara:strand:+ start:1587 stop:1934 length:348 start_codon:yes stop_codon:yes gene_type:complete